MLSGILFYRKREDVLVGSNRAGNVTGVSGKRGWARLRIGLLSGFELCGEVSMGEVIGEMRYLRIEYILRCYFFAPFF